MTETSGGCVYDGVPLDGVSYRVGNSETIELSGPTLAAGYRLDPAATAAAFRDGWFRTSDRGSINDNGRLVVLGRADDAILTGGVTVDPLQVEAALATHPAIEAAAVIGCPDQEWGERVTAIVVPRRADDVPDLDQLRAWVAQRLGAVHSPREVITANSLPMLPTGKVDRSAIRKAVGHG
jgi:O-succinylbenzoic acid--CoA ligase